MQFDDATGEKTRVDTVDARILEALSAHGRESARKLAKRVGIAPATLLNRMTRMEREGIIREYAAILDYSKLGYDFLAIIEIVIRRGTLLEVQHKIAQLPGVVSVYDVTGESDSFVLARCKTRREFSLLVKKILSIENVERTNTHVILNVVKEGGRMQPQELIRQARNRG